MNTSDEVDSSGKGWLVDATFWTVVAPAGLGNLFFDALGLRFFAIELRQSAVTVGTGNLRAGPPLPVPHSRAPTLFSNLPQSHVYVYL